MDYSLCLKECIATQIISFKDEHELDIQDLAKILDTSHPRTSNI